MHNQPTSRRWRYTQNTREVILNFAPLQRYAYPDHTHILISRISRRSRPDAAPLKSEPERAEAERRDGTAFLAKRYSNDSLIAYLDRFLFLPRSGRTFGGATAADATSA